MNLLLDTQILIWWQLDDPKLGRNSSDLLAQPGNTVYVSQLSLIEIAIKQSLGKLPELDVSPKVLSELIKGDGFTLLALQTGHIDAYANIPLYAQHRDPFDRILFGDSVSRTTANYLC